jgi:nucleoside-diphosphate-sugar epimerase
LLTIVFYTEPLARIFDRSNGKQWDYVFNCGGETRYSQEDEVYKVRSLALSVAVGKEAAKRGVKAFVELSTGMVYKPDSQPSKEGDKLKPWSKIAVFKLQAEEQLAKIDGYVSLPISIRLLEFVEVLELRRKWIVHFRLTFETNC